MKRFAERRVNQGGESGYDEYGLPPVDVVVPDDARELYRDVQVYHRELRALRRQERSIRWRAPFRRSGVALPLIAGCLVAALVAVMVSAMFTSNPYYNQSTGPAPSNQAAGPAGTGTTGSTGRTSSGSGSASPSHQLTDQAGHVKLPSATLLVGRKSLSVRKLSNTILAIVPATCHCTKAVAMLLRQAEATNLILYVVVPRGSVPVQIARLVAATQRKTTQRKAWPPRVATDKDNVLTAMYQKEGLTLLLVGSSGLATVQSGLDPDRMIQEILNSSRRAR